jgi:CubicO group peptidase (beta-lactamase class C family)
MEQLNQKWLRIAALASSLLLGACGGSSSTTEPVVIEQVSATATLVEKLQAIDDYLISMHAQGDFNGAILIAKKGEPLLINTHGFTDATKSRALTNDSSFRLASVSKQFTAMAVMILQERGLLDYNDLVSDHISELDYDNITIEHLMHHTSGIQDYTFFPKSYVTEQGALFMTMQVFFNIVAEHPLNQEFIPQSQFSYSNTGYILLAEIVARVSGQSFEDFMHDEIFAPLGMSNSDVWSLLSDTQSGRLPNRTQGTIGTQAAHPSYLDGIAGDGAVFASITDFLKWDRALTDNTLVSEQTKQLAFTPATLSDGSQTNYGYGWIVSESNEYVSHSGGWLGARTLIVRNINTGGLIVLLDSSATTKLSEVVEFIDSQLVGEGF